MMTVGLRGLLAIRKGQINTGLRLFDEAMPLRVGSGITTGNLEPGTDFGGVRRPGLLLGAAAGVLLLAGAIAYAMAGDDKPVPRTESTVQPPKISAAPTTPPTATDSQPVQKPATSETQPEEPPTVKTDTSDEAKTADADNADKIDRPSTPRWGPVRPVAPRVPPSQKPPAPDPKGWKADDPGF